MNVNVLHALTGRRGAAPTLLALAVVVALVALAAGCGSSTTTTTSASPTPAASGSTAAATWTSADLAGVTTTIRLTAMLPSDVQSSGEIKCLSDIPYPPWEYFDPPDSTNPAGFDYDLSQALGKKMGVTVKFTDIAVRLRSCWRSRAARLTCPCRRCTTTRSGRRPASASWTTPSTAPAWSSSRATRTGITNLDSLAGKTVACENGTTQQAFLTRLNKEFESAGKEKMQILSLPGQPEALLAVKSNRAVADLTDYSTAVYIATTTNDGSTFEVVKDPDAPYDPQMDGIAFKSTNTQLIDTVQKALQALIDDGTYAKIIAAWEFAPVESATVNEGPSYAASHTTTVQ